MKTKRFILVWALISFTGMVFAQKGTFDNTPEQYLAMINPLPSDYLNNSGILDRDFLGTNKGNIVCKKISLGIGKAKVTLNDGEKVIIPIRDLNSYSLNGKKFDKLMIFENGHATGKMGFMEKVSERDGFSLYKYSTYIPDLKDKVDLFYVYKDGRYNCSITTNNCRRALQYFNVQMNRVFVES